MEVHTSCCYMDLLLRDSYMTFGEKKKSVSDFCLNCLYRKGVQTARTSYNYYNKGKIPPNTCTITSKELEDRLFPVFQRCLL